MTCDKFLHSNLIIKIKSFFDLNLSLADSKLNFVDYNLKIYLSNLLLLLDLRFFIK